MIWLPIVISVVCAFLIFRPLETHDSILGFGLELFEILFRLLWFIPALISWIVYLALT